MADQADYKLAQSMRRRSSVPDVSSMSPPKSDMSVAFEEQLGPRSADPTEGMGFDDTLWLQRPTDEQIERDLEVQAMGDRMRRDRRSQRYQGYGDTMQDYGDRLSLTPPVGPVGTGIQTVGDLMYAAGAGIQAYQGVPGKKEEMIGGLAAAYNPIPDKLSLGKGGDRMYRNIPVTRAQAIAARELAYSQAAQETGEQFGEYNTKDSNIDTPTPVKIDER